MQKDIKIALCGLAGSGKDRVASIITEIMSENNPDVILTSDNFANPIRVFSSKLFNWNEEHTLGLLKEVPNTFVITLQRFNDAAKWYRNNLEYYASFDSFWNTLLDILNDLGAITQGDVWVVHGLSPRRLLQLTGTEVGRKLCPNIWIDFCLSKKPNIITDTRFITEAQGAKAAGYSLVKVEADFTRIDSGSDASKHVSEQQLDLIKQDFTLDNRFEVRSDKSLGILKQRVHYLMQALLQK